MAAFANLQKEIAASAERSKQASMFDPNAERKQGELGQAQIEVQTLNERIAQFEADTKQLEVQTQAAFEQNSNSARTNIAAGLLESAAAGAGTLAGGIINGATAGTAVIANAIATAAAGIHVTATVTAGPNVGTTRTTE